VTHPPALCLRAGRPPAFLTAEAHDAAILRLRGVPGTNPNGSLFEERSWARNPWGKNRFLTRSLLSCARPRVICG
jgi:hypothetical protein